MVSTPPRFMNSFSWITRSNFAWVSWCTVPISSKKMLPPSAISNSPFFGEIAPVKAPFTWPNRLLSRSSGGRLPEWTVTNGRLRRGLRRWIAFATSSFPVPLSPVTSTFDREAATCSISAYTSCIRGDFPTSSSNLSRRTSCSRRLRFSRASRR